MDPAALPAASPMLAIAAAFLAGVASSASPCAIAAMPLVVGYVGGYAGDDRRRAFLYASAFVLGMAVTFTAAGVAAAVVGALFGASSIYWQGLMALLAIAFGGHLLGLWAVPGLGGMACPAAAGPRWRGATGAVAAGALAGVAFAPCATPMLAGILAVVGSQGDIVFGTTLLFLYAVGHGALLLAAGSSVSLARRLLLQSRLAQAGKIMLRLAGGLLAGYGLYLAWGLSRAFSFNL